MKGTNKKGSGLLNSRFLSSFRGLGGRGWGVLLFLLLLVSCNPGGSKKLNRRVTLWRKDKIPYGTYIAYENLYYLFPNAEITINENSPTDLKSPAYGNGYAGLNKEGKKAYIIIVPRMQPDVSEINALLNFVGEGNHV